MRTYRLTRDKRHACIVHVFDGKNVHLPMLIASDQYPAWPMLTVATTLLLDYFEGEEQAEVKAQLMARALVHYLNRLGEKWTLTEEQLSDAVMNILVSRKTTIEEAANDLCVEYLGGQRRDTLRSDVT